MSKDIEDSMQRAVASIVSAALDEDVGPGDVTSIATIDEDATASAEFVVKANGVLSGTGPATLTFRMVDATTRLEWSFHDGDRVSTGDVIGRVVGKARSILTAERTALNILQRMSGIATMTASMTSAARPYGVRVLDTRKTAPGLRMLDKMAVVDGGGVNHRAGLFDMMLIKDNHIAASGSISQALENAQAYRNTNGGGGLMIEIEARTLQEVRQVIEYWESRGVPDRILLDNMARKRPDGSLDVSLLREAVEMISGRIETEASGNVELPTVAAIAETGVDFVSSGALTHSVKALDVSLEFSLSG